MSGSLERTQNRNFKEIHWQNFVGAKVNGFREVLSNQT